MPPRLAGLRAVYSPRSVRRDDSMRNLPVFLDVATRPCLIVGGGIAAARRAELLLEAGAHPTIVAPEVGPAIERVAASGAPVKLIRREYAREDVTGMALVFAATDDPELGERVARDAAHARVWCNIADRPVHCT